MVKDDLPQAEIGIFGGSGFYDLFENNFQVVKIDTRWGLSSIHFLRRRRPAMSRSC